MRRSIGYTDPSSHLPSAACALHLASILTVILVLCLSRYHPSWEAWRISGVIGSPVETWEEVRKLVK